MRMALTPEAKTFGCSGILQRIQSAPGELGLSDGGACRLCLVDIEGQKKLQASCLTRIEEGLVVRTDTPKLIRQRKLILEPTGKALSN